MREEGYLSGTALKWIAVVTMTLDHLGAVIIRHGLLYVFLRVIGRLAFPIYCMLLVEGHAHTHDRYRYLFRLGIFALLSEIPFNLAVSGNALDLTHQNVFFTLCLAEGMLILIDELKKRWEDPTWISLATLALGILCMVIAEFSHMDYGMCGILLIFILRILYPWKWKDILTVSVVMLLCWHNNWIQMLAVIAFPMAYLLYNGERGRTGKFMKYAFYVYYPLHLLIFALIRLWG